jgi:hypothetical protein
MRQQLISPNQTVLGSFANQQQAEQALAALQAEQFAASHLAILPQSLSPNPSFYRTEARRSAAGGAMAGTVFGLMSGLLLGYMIVISPYTAQSNLLVALTGMTLLGAGIGAAGGSLIAALSGATVMQAAANPAASDPDRQYILVAEQVNPAEIDRARSIVAQFGMAEI